MCMEKQHDNRRVRVTKRMIKEALLELLEHDDLVDISITALCEAADVHRSTFYNYYSDPSDVLREIEQDFLDRIPVPPDKPEQVDAEQLLEKNTAFFDYVKDNDRVFRILFDGSKGSCFAARLVETLCAGYIPVNSDADEITAGFIRKYVANGTVGMMREWVNTGYPVSSREIAEKMYFLSVRITG